MAFRKHNYSRAISFILCLFLLIGVFGIPAHAAGNGQDEVILGGCLFGITMVTDGVPVVGLEKVETENGACSPAYDAGIKMSDVITNVNGKTASSARQITELVKNSNGQNMEFTVMRNGEKKSFNIVPVKGKDGTFHIGIWIRDSAAGIGTVTYIDPKTFEFGGLGHGICDADTTSLLPLKRGSVNTVELQSVVKGQKGIPGELKGTFTGNKIGAVVKNTPRGVYGVFCNLPKGTGQRIKVASQSEVKEGKATILSSVDGQIREYSIMITKVNIHSEQGKNYHIKITDKALIEKTGGIVQGMGVCYNRDNTVKLE